MIANIKATEGIGQNVLKKTIHEGSESIMFSVLQETQYMYPVKSSVREIVSNSLDSVNERNNSLKIMNGEIEESDLFIEKEGTEFKESKFDSSYYDPKWLSEDDTITIRYIENDTETRDKIEFIDNGVGLGGDRLIKYFSLGFSTKRLSKNQLGSFGLGAKSLLATGVEFYTVTSRYNGREYKFDVYKDHVMPAIGRFEEDGTENKLETFYNDYKTYYRKTDKLNAVIVDAEVKRHRKQDYIGAIENQLGYIDNIVLFMKDKEYANYDTQRNIKNNILFSTDKILVGESDYYAKPQILLTPGTDSPIKISYGPINFDELEMKRYGGNVSFIMNINEVDVTPSREHVIWNTKTRNAIKNMFETAQETVADVIAEKLKDEKYLSQHLTLLESFKSKNSIDGLAELYKVIDTSKINLKFRNFSLSKAVIAMDNSGDSKKCIFTTTEIISDWRSARTRDTNFGSSLNKKYIASLSANNNNFNHLTVYIGDVKYKNLARYVKDQFDHEYQKQLDIIYFKTELFEAVTAKVKEFGGIDPYLEAAYVHGDNDQVIYGEIMRAIENGVNVLKEEDIDKTLMGTLEEKEKEVTSTRYMTNAERAKIDGKVHGTIFSGNYGYKEYFNEFTFKSSPGTNYILYSASDEFSKSIIEVFRREYTNIPDGYKIVSFSEDNFKRFIKQDNCSTLTGSLYKISYGDLELTSFGTSVCPQSLLKSIQGNSRPMGDAEEFKNYRNNNIFDYLKGHYADIKIVDKVYQEELNAGKKRFGRRQARASLENEQYTSIDQLVMSKEDVKIGVLTEPMKKHKIK